MKQNATLKYSDIEDGQIISDDSESDNATNQAATPLIVQLLRNKAVKVVLSKMKTPRKQKQMPQSGIQIPSAIHTEQKNQNGHQHYPNIHHSRKKIS